ncbi:MAG: hypothetical protein JWR32_2998 [Mycobacterium sp.]|jgi:hypothetical protein|nr:hypothetical protein [Mycobacterium sp.]
MSNNTPRFFQLHRIDRPGTVRHELKSNAEKYRLRRGEELLREAGFIEQPDGTWRPA